MNNSPSTVYSIAIVADSRHDYDDYVRWNMTENPDIKTVFVSNNPADEKSQTIGVHFLGFVIITKNKTINKHVYDMITKRIQARCLELY